MNSLPEVKFVEPLGEIEVCINLIHPLLSPLFYDKDNSFLRWCNKISEEAKESRTNVNKSRRPDAIIWTILQNHVGCNKGFGEVKITEGLKNKYGLVKDLVRLSRTFSKEAIGLNDTKCNMSPPSYWAGHIFFYAHTLLADGLYAMIELCDVVAPSCLSDLITFLSELDKLKLVYSIFVSSCKQLDEIETSWKRHTLDSPTFSQCVLKDTGKQPGGGNSWW
ncbi:hypothetical protein INT47_009615 [Mucor saturninus]|uniref:Uncharacterized protein n=1 Tax=Mucor saturninus TaxID=64648 RepID=A0A8H7QR22_9FUNG|nr:hypothetical protein INT47_009615 [Mucor saturninus]